MNMSILRPQRVANMRVREAAGAALVLVRHMCELSPARKQTLEIEGAPAEHFLGHRGRAARVELRHADAGPDDGHARPLEQTTAAALDRGPQARNRGGALARDMRRGMGRIILAWRAGGRASAARWHGCKPGHVVEEGGHRSATVVVPRPSTSYTNNPRTKINQMRILSGRTLDTPQHRTGFVTGKINNTVNIRSRFQLFDPDDPAGSSGSNN